VVTGLRYFGGSVAFGFAAVWIIASLAAAFVCLLSAVVGYGAILLIERLQARHVTRAGRRLATPSARPSRSREAPLPQWADALNSDLGHIYEPSAATSALSREAEYGWPRGDDTLITSGTLQ
jgi:hypothetical protein